MKVNITILTSDEKYNIFPMFVSENIYENELNLFNYQNHICHIKHLNKYLCRNNKYNNKSYFRPRCLYSFTSEENLSKHKYLCLKYKKKSEKLILPNENLISKFEKINHMIKTPFTIYYDIETYNQHLKKTKQHETIKNTSHEKLLKPYLCGYILKNNYDEKFSKKSQIFTGTNCIEKMSLNLIFTEKPYINEITLTNQLKKILIYQNLI